MKSLRQAFALVVITLVAYGVYTFVFSKHVVDNSIPEELMQELAQEGININNLSGIDGKSALFDNLTGAPSITSNSVVSSASIPSVISGTPPRSVTPGPPFASSFSLEDAPLFDRTLSVVPATSTHDLVPAPFPVAFPGELPGNMPTELPLPGDNLPDPPFEESAPFLIESPDSALDGDPFSIPLPVSQKHAGYSGMSDNSWNSGSFIDTFTSTGQNTSTTESAIIPLEQTRPEQFSVEHSPLTAPTNSILNPNQSTPFVESDAVDFVQHDVYYTPVQTPAQNLPVINDPVPANSGLVQPLPPVEEQYAVVSMIAPQEPNDSAVIPLPPVPESTEPFQTTSMISPSQQLQDTSVPTVASYTPVQTSLTQDFPVPALAHATSVQPVQNPPELTQSPMVSSPEVRPEFIQQINKIRHILNYGDYREGHRRITELYHLDLYPAERKLLFPILDQCGWAAFFSRSYFPLNSAHVVTHNDTIESLANVFQVTPELIRKINGLSPDIPLQIGQELKIPKEPFHAFISLSKRELVLYSEGLYACRFRVGVDESGLIRETTYQIEDKFKNPRYIGENGEIESGDPANPLGTRWIGLEGAVGIHGTNDLRWVGSNQSPIEGFCMDNNDIEELYDMLTAPSTITIRR